MTNETILDASLSNLTTELVNPLTSAISSPNLSTGQMLRLINDEDQKVATAVRDERCMEVLAKVVDIVAEKVKNGGRVIYFGK
jgi:N-acetylmuramic acid 6-phosphate etherase